MSGRQSANWMKREDERILEYLEKQGLSSPWLISREVFEKVCEGHVDERLTLLQDAELVTESGLGSYELTQAGERYLAGDLDAAHQPTPRMDRVLRG